jgi:sulfonate transport system substrate-binding protein
VLVTSILLAAGATATAAESTQPAKMRITYVKLPLNVPSIVVKHLGLMEEEFEPDGIAIERPEITSGGKQTQALAANAIDIASVVSSTAAITARANGVGLKIVAVFARAPRAFNIAAVDPGIQKVADLKGRMVAGPKGSLLNQTLFAALLSNGLHPEDVGYVHMGVSKAMAALIGGSVDAALIAGPFVPKAESQGARIIANGEGLVKGLIVTAVRQSFLERHPNLVRRYLATREKAFAFMCENPDKTIAMVARETGIGVDDIKRMLPWYDFSMAITSSDVVDLQATQAFLLQSGMLQHPTRIEDMVVDMANETAKAGGQHGRRASN